MNHLRLVLLSLLLVFITTSDAQTTIWSVDFETGYSDNDETAQDNNAPTGTEQNNVSCTDLEQAYKKT